MISGLKCFRKLFFAIHIFFVFNILVFSQGREYRLNEVVISAARVPVSIAHLARTVLVIDSIEIKSLPSNNIQDLLKYAGSVDLRTRGVEGVQGDAAIRGGSFEQTLILINGVKISDPQTGHHNLNVSLSLKNVERIEILKGQGSRVFGPNAFGGAINIITKKGNEPSLSISALGGEHNLYETSVVTSYPFSVFGNSFSFLKKKSDGYRHNTDFDITNFSLNQSISFGKQITNLFFGYVDKKFGANSLVSFCLGFTEVDPLEHNLYFERFLNRGRTSPPDVDLDFSWKERDEIIKYLFERYGYDKVAMISTTVTFRARSVFREVAKIFGIPDSEISKYSKFIPWTSAKNLPNIAEKFPETRSLDFKHDPWKSIVNTASKLAGYPRHLSIHPSGIIITRSKITDYVALEFAKNKGLGLIVTQPDMYPVEDLGLIKIDLLSQRSLGVLKETMKEINEETTSAPASIQSISIIR